MPRMARRRNANKTTMNTLKKQNEIINKYFGITVDIPQTLPQVNKEADGLFLIPNWQRLGKTYNEAVIKVIESLKKDIVCYDYLGGNWGEKYLKQIEREVPEILSCQIGKKHKGKSVKNVREIKSENEILLGIYEVAIILLTNPDILKSYDYLWIDCPGDKYSYLGAGRFGKAPFLFFDDGRLWFHAGDCDVCRDRYGSASGFLSQYETGTLEPSESFETYDFCSCPRCKQCGKLVQNLT
jgi:hypothetical protein